MEAYADLVVTFVRDNMHLAIPIIFVLAFGESLAFVSLILPFWGILIALGALVGASGASLLPIWISASIGAALGDWVSYWLGKHYNVQLGRMWPLKRYPDLIPKGKMFFDKWGIWAIVLGRFSGPLRASVPLVAGMMVMPWAAFQLANFGSAFLWAGVLLFPGVLSGVLPWKTLIGG
jgi:membrane protein DedA with SNARE-associated domain